MAPSSYRPLKQLFESVPFMAFLGMRFEILEDGLSLIRIPFRPELIGNPELPALHGGVISALLDTAGGAATWTRIGEHDRVSTVDLRVDYLRPGRPEDILGRARVIRAGNRVAVTELRAFQPGSPEEPIAIGTGVYNIHRRRGGGGTGGAEG
jgi:uncharacterized protein (TIGR00369 family)